jgi:phosphoglycolate phosphatase-like HAD superfamily hydrolase
MAGMIGWIRCNPSAPSGMSIVMAASGIVVGDSVWDLLAAGRARALGVGLLSGGYGREELERAGAYRVYDDPGDLLRHLDEIGVRPSAQLHLRSR